MLQVIVPLKNLALAKGRLSGMLDDGPRMDLVAAMASDLLEVLDDNAGVAGISVVLGDHWKRRLPRLRKLQCIPEADLEIERGNDSANKCGNKCESTGLNSLLESAVSSLQSARTLVLHGDLPYFGPADLDHLQRLLQREKLVLCPDAAEQGTNGLAFKSGAKPEFRFGKSSFQQHRRAAIDFGCTVGIMRSPGFALDMDTPDDLRRLIHGQHRGERAGPRTSRWALQYQCGRSPSVMPDVKPHTTPGTKPMPLEVGDPVT